MSAEPDPLPVDTIRDAIPFLRRPFTVAAVRFKVQAQWPKDNPTGGLIVPYIDARLAIERLNRVCPHLWQDAYTPIGGKQMWCHLTVDGVQRHDVGEGDGKGLVSDALKRAAVKFGVGVSLYAIPKMMLDVQGGGLKQRRDGLEITAAGERRLRDLYAKWLRDHGSSGYGEPLDHGDVEGAQGDQEIEPPRDRLDADSWCDWICSQIRALGLKASDVRRGVQQTGAVVPERPSWSTVLAGLDREQRAIFELWLGGEATKPDTRAVA